MKPIHALRSLAVILCVAPALSGSAARADTLWYNGDYDNRDALKNASGIGINTNQGVETSLVFDNFIVPVGQTWTVTGLFSNDQVAYYSNVAPLATVTAATWQIRSGVGPGSGGTLVASGDTAATQTAIAPVAGYYYVAPEVRIATTGLSVTLAAGTYWLAIAPDDPNGFIGDQSYIETTGGANAVGLPKGNDGNSYVTNTLPAALGGLSFAPTGPVLAADGVIPAVGDFSMGVIGTSAAVPEPSSLALGLLGGLGGAACLRRRRRG